MAVAEVVGMELAFESGARKASGVIFGIMGISDDTRSYGEDLGTSLSQGLSGRVH